MDVFIEIPATSSTYGYRFAVKVEYLDTVRQMKEKVQMHLGIPVAAQRLFFRSQELADDLGAGYYSILRGSHVLLLLRQPPAPAPSVVLLLPAKRARTMPDLVHVTATFPFYHTPDVSVIAFRNETVAALKRRIHSAARMDEHELERMAAVLGGAEMEDDLPLLVYVQPTSSVLEVKVMLKPAEVGCSSDAGSRTMAVELHVEDAEVGVLAVVSLSDAVMELRQQLSLLADIPELPLLARGDYFFEFDGKAMDDTRSLRAHGFQPGDIIHVIPAARAGAPARASETGVF